MKTLALATLLLGGVIAAAQAPPDSPVFEAASVRQNRDGGSIAGLRRIPGGRFEATNIQLSALISFAYQLQPYELLDGPSWFDSERWDVVAKMAGDPPPAPAGTPDALMLATRALLTERFKLAVRRDTREMDVYLLVKANADGRLGPGLRRSETDCLAIQKATDEAARGGPPAPNPNTPDRMVCGMRVGANRIQFGGRPLATVLNVLTPMTQRRIVDRTGLDGNWQFDIRFSPPPGLPPGADVPPPDPDAPSLFTVLQEQLGLRLQSARIPMPVLVVERVERPVQD